MSDSLSVLEFNKILENVSSFAASEPTRIFIRNFDCVHEKSYIVRLQDLTDEADKMKNKYFINPVGGFDSVSEFIEKAVKGGTLTMSELLCVNRLLRAQRIAKNNIESAPDDIVILKELTFRYYLNVPLEKRIDECIVGENEMSDNASPKLKSVRQKIAVVNRRIKDKVSSYFHSNETSKYLQDNIMTVRGGRFVLPVKSECRSGVPGLIHDSSSSGATVFIEPFALVEMNNELRALQIEEQEEIERILIELSQSVAAYSATMAIGMESLIEIEFAFARADYSASINGVRPLINESGVMNLIESRHPLLDPKSVVPNTISVGANYRVLAITGPNTGGKTVALKTVGLLSLMTYAGLRIPCREGSEVSVFDNIFCGIGDEQSIELSLSTFSSHICNISFICDNLTNKSLVLLDEVGGGTDPKEGAALAVGIIKYLEIAGCCAVITTHYPEIKEYALLSDKSLNACMQFDQVNFRPTYRLLMGVPGASNAVKIAENLGLNSYIIKEASAMLVSERSFEDVIAEVEKIKAEAIKELETAKEKNRYAADLKQALEKQREDLAKKYEQISAGAKNEIRRLIAAKSDVAEELIEQLREKIKQADEKALFEARSIKKQLESLDVPDTEVVRPHGPLKEEDLKEGNKVFVKNLNGVGVILSAVPNKKGEWKIRVGALTLNVKKEDLASVDEEPKPVKAKFMPKTQPRGEGGVYPETVVNVMGQTVSDAITVIEPYIISMACEDGSKILKIIHGKGTGALGKGIHEYLKSNRMVASFRYGKYGEGDNGVTFAEIK